MCTGLDNHTTGIFSEDTLNDRIRRISYYEELLRKAEEILHSTGDCTPASLAGMVRELDAYYGSREWREDLAADEAGELPEDLRRGVLSEDGIWNVLQEYRERTAAGEEPEQ